VWVRRHHPVRVTLGPAPPCGSRAAWIREAVRTTSAALDDVRTPVLVHFDLWDGNILLDRISGSVEIGGLIDAERAFWGDPPPTSSLSRCSETSSGTQRSWRATGRAVVRSNSASRCAKVTGLLRADLDALDGAASAT
jgi:Phosphotransferase enzyme family